MIIQFLKDCGHRKEGQVLEVSIAHGEQYIAAKFAEQYTVPTPPIPSKTIIDGSLQNLDVSTDESMSDDALDSFLSRLPKPVAIVLADAGFEFVEEVEATSDEDLLAIDGIGKATLEKIRAAHKEE